MHQDRSLSPERLPGLIAKLAQSSTREKGHRMQGRTLLPLIPLP